VQQFPEIRQAGRLSGSHQPEGMFLWMSWVTSGDWRDHASIVGLTHPENDGHSRPALAKLTKRPGRDWTDLNWTATTWKDNTL
jgi:hypothetical protein